MRTSILIVTLLLVAAPIRADELAARSEATPITSTAPAWSMGTPGLGPLGLLSPSLFDPSRFTISNSLSVGYTSGGAFRGSSGLFTSSLGYRVSSSSRLRLDLGAYTNPAFGGAARQGVFVQGAAFDWRPTSNALFRFEYRDLRSPLQYGASPYGYGSYGRWDPRYVPNESRFEDDEFRRN